MFTTNCDAVSTKSWFCAALASSARWCFAVSSDDHPQRGRPRRAPSPATPGRPAPGGLPAAAAGRRAWTVEPWPSSALLRARPSTWPPHRWPVRPPSTHDALPPASAVASKPCLRSSTPALEPTSDQPSFPRAPVCQFHLRTRQFPRLGRRTSRSGRRWRSSGHSPAAAPRRAAAARPQAEARPRAVAPAAAAVHPPAGGGGVLPYGGTTWSGGA